MKQIYETGGKKTRIFELPKIFDDKSIVNIPFDKTQFRELDNILWWFKIRDDIPTQLEDRVARLIAHIRNYSR